MNDLRSMIGGQARDPLMWAKRLKSAKAVEFLLSGAHRDHRLLEIARQHVRDGGASIQCESARRYLAAATRNDARFSESAE